MDKKISKAEKGLRGEITIPADKSISHRAVMFSSLANGKSIIKNFSNGADPHSTLQIFKNLGVKFEFLNNELHVTSSGKLTPINNTLDCGNSGTTMRLVSGILAGQNFDSILTGDESLSKRPMKRIIEPLSLMGAKIKSNENKAPLEIYGQDLTGIEYQTPIASAQVKSAILLAGLFANGKTTITEPSLSRNHTELMLSYMGANIKTNGNCAIIPGGKKLQGAQVVSTDLRAGAAVVLTGLVADGTTEVSQIYHVDRGYEKFVEKLRALGANIMRVEE